jgi:hypothetical protein
LPHPFASFTGERAGSEDFQTRASAPPQNIINRIRLICMRKVYLAVAALSASVLLAQTSSAQTAKLQVRTIRISPAWGGPDGPDGAIVTIRNVKGVFRRTWTSAVAAENNVFKITITSPDDPATQVQPSPKSPRNFEDVVNTSDVSALIRALDAPKMAAPTLLNLGITHAWLEQHAEKASKNLGTLGESNDERQQQFFRDSFTDISLITRLIPHVVNANWTDDGVWVQVTVEFSSGEVWTAESSSQPVFMLPWKTMVRGQGKSTYNSDISRAIARLLPESAVNRDRLEGTELEDQLRFAVESATRQEWQQIGAEDKAGADLALLRQRYTIKRSEVSEHIGLSFGPMHEGEEENLQADVRLGSFPSNLLVATVFPLENGKAVGIDNFLRDGDIYEQIVLTNPWIMESLRSHSGLGAWLVFVRDASMSEKAMSIFAADMHALGRDDLAQEVSQHRREVADLSYYGNELILFSDHHAIVWRWDPNRDLFKWRASELKTDRCTDYEALDEGCVAAVIDPNGNLVR